jgi:hypothetical protein
MLDKSLFYLSGGIPDPQRVRLRAGDLTVDFVDGALRDFRVTGVEVLRMVYAAVRDANWGTVPFTLSDVKIDARERDFDLSFAADHRHGDVHFVWHGTITGRGDSSITFDFDGEARTTFARNRIGFCVLHPGSFTNAVCRVEHTDGRIIDRMFPEPIMPHQPFLDIRAITSERDGLRVEVRMEGDTFEMEDQRNWTDDSFKTYCTPLALPYPVTVAAGTRIQQRISVRLDERPSDMGRPDDTRTLVMDEYYSVERPPLGLCIASDDMPLTPREIERLKALKLAHLRVELHVSDSMWRERLHHADEQARQVGCALEIAAFVTDDAEAQLAALAEAADSLQAKIARWLIFHEREKSTTARWIGAARAALGRFNAPIGAGTPYYFTELNRERPPENADFNVYSINPQVHAFDNASLMETVRMHLDTAENAAFNGKSVVVSPITLKPRGNPNATTPDAPPDPHALPPTVDPRQLSLFGAVWTFGSIVNVSHAGVLSVTYYETVGWRGVMERESGSPLPDAFPSIAGGVYPLYHVLADINEFAVAKVGVLRLLDNSRFIGLASEGERTILLANLTPNTQPVMIGLNEPAYRLRVLDETSVEFAMREPEAWRATAGERIAAVNGVIALTLRPYAYVRLDRIDS